MKSHYLLILIISIILSGVIHAQNDFTTTRISVFKNGTGFFIKEGKVDAPDGEYVINSTPSALFGTFWINSASGNLKSLRTLQEKSTEEKDATSIKEILSGNINKKAKIILNNNAFYDVTILDVKDMVATFQTKDKWVSTDINEIKTVEFLELPDLKYEMKTNTSKIAVSFANKGKNDLYMMYLQKGIGWFPSYLIEIDEEGNAVVRLRSTVMNDIEDINDAELSFVVGVPNFKYNYLESPLTSDQSLVEFISSLSAGAYSSYNTLDNSNILSNAIMTQAVSPRYDIVQPDVPLTEFSSEVSNQEDLYFYKHEHVSLKKGERAVFELLNTKLPYEHIYEVNLNQNNLNSYYYTNTYTDASVNKVWHSIKMNNTTKMPWTTGTAMVVKKSGNTSKPISQDMMKYTPVNSDTYLKITMSPDISIKDKDKETARVEKSRKSYNDYYDLVTVEGNIVIKNFKNKDVKIDVKRTILGELKNSSVNWVFNKMPSSYYYNINPSNEVSWDVNMKAGEEKEITYTYTVYVNR